MLMIDTIEVNKAGHRLRVDAEFAENAYDSGWELSDKSDTDDDGEEDNDGDIRMEDHEEGNPTPNSFQERMYAHAAY